MRRTSRCLISAIALIALTWATTNSRAEVIRCQQPVTVQLVAVSQPTSDQQINIHPLDLTNLVELRSQILSIEDGITLELWVTTPGPNGVTSAYADIVFSPMTVLQLDGPDAVAFAEEPWGEFASAGPVMGGALTDLGMTVSPGEGTVAVAPTWSRVATLHFDLLEEPTSDLVFSSLQPTTFPLGMAVHGCGLVEASIVNHSTYVIIADECQLDSNCDDGDPCTEDVCTEAYVCSNEEIPGCGGRSTAGACCVAGECVDVDGYDACQALGNDQTRTNDSRKPLKLRPDRPLYAPITQNGLPASVNLYLQLLSAPPAQPTHTPGDATFLGEGTTCETMSCP